MTIDVRHEQPGDEAAIRRVNDDAFGQSEESRIVDAARARGHLAVSLVAVEDSAVVGHILFTPVAVEGAHPGLSVLGLGPMAVAPHRQRQGIGTTLVESGLRECRRRNFDVVVVIGHPEYYSRFGFRCGGLFGLHSEFDVPDDVFMVRELKPGVLAGVTGLVRHVPEFRGV